VPVMTAGAASVPCRSQQCLNLRCRCPVLRGATLLHESNTPIRHQLSNWSMQAVEAACEGEPGLWDKVAASGAFDTGLMDVTRLHLGF